MFLSRCTMIRMKAVIALLVLPMLFSLAACTAKKPDIKVGMTYDEVEKAIGRPEAITRGVNQVSLDEEGYFEVQTIGQLLYVTWQYPDTITANEYSKRFYEVKCVTFDASSGRVVTSGYQPVRRVDK